MIVYNTVDDIVRICRENNMLFWQVVMRADAQERMVSEDISFAAMREMYRAMKRADSEYDKNLKSPSGLSGGDGAPFSGRKRGTSRSWKIPLGCRLFCFTVRRRSAPFSLPGIPAP